MKLHITTALWMMTRSTLTAPERVLLNTGYHHTALEGMMKALGTPGLTPALKQKVVDAVLGEAGGRPG